MFITVNKQHIGIPPTTITYEVPDYRHEHSENYKMNHSDHLTIFKTVNLF